MKFNYDIFNYFNRQLFLPLILIFIFLLIKKFAKNNIKNKSLITLLYIILVFFNINSFDAFLFKFKSVDDAFNFFKPNETIINKYVFDDYAYIEYGKRGHHNVMYYKKENDSWKIGKTKLGRINSYHIINDNIYIYPERKKILVLDYFIHDTDKSKKIVKRTKDSLNSEVKTNMYARFDNRYHVLQTIFLDDKIDKDYKVHVVDSDYGIGN